MTKLKAWKFFALLLFVSLVLVGWNRYQSYRHSLRELEFLQPAKAITDAQQSIKNGGLHFVGVYGTTLLVPGITGDQFSEIAVRAGIKPIQGTGDDGRISSEAMERVSEYAKIYNRYILQELKKDTNKDSPYQFVVRSIDHELSGLEKQSAASLLHRNLESSTLNFFSLVTYNSYELPGISAKEADTYIRYRNGIGTKELVSKYDVMTRQQIQRFERNKKQLIIPYNKLLLQHIVKPRRYLPKPNSLSD